VAHYLFNFVKGRQQAAELIQLKMWPIDAEERHRDALTAGDLVLIYLAAPERELIGRAEVAGELPHGVSLTDVEEWDPPVPMSEVLPRIDSPQARADFEAEVVEITAHEYETALAVAAERTTG
jgi:hypothetical protein